MKLSYKIEILKILFKDLEKGEKLTEEQVDQVLETVASDPIKRIGFKRRMIEKYGPDVFVRRAAKMNEAKKGDYDQNHKQIRR